jgi:hypothetical protein
MKRRPGRHRQCVMIPTPGRARVELELGGLNVNWYSALSEALAVRCRIPSNHDFPHPPHQKSFATVDLIPHSELLPTPVFWPIFNTSFSSMHMPATPACPPPIDVSSSSSSHRAALGLEIDLILVTIRLVNPFLRFAQKVDLLSSIPLIFHHWREVVDLWPEALELADDEGLRALLE